MWAGTGSLWTASRRNFAPIRPKAHTGVLSRGAITLDVNGVRRQTGDLADMIWDVPNTLSFLSRYYELLPGALVFTGKLRRLARSSSNAAARWCGWRVKDPRTVATRATSSAAGIPPVGIWPR